MFSTWHPYKERYAQFLEALQLMTEAWTKKSVSFSGKFYDVQDCVVEPKPVQKPYPPLLFGGWSNNRIVGLAGQKGRRLDTNGPEKRRGGKITSRPVDSSWRLRRDGTQRIEPRKNSPTDADSAL